MITKVIIENFKCFERQVFDLGEVIVLAGPNNSGKSTLLQALATWSMALDRWRLGKGRSGKARQRAGTPVTRKDFTALPLREFNLLWHERSTGLTKGELGPEQHQGEPRLIHITIHGSAGLTSEKPWSLTMELRYQGPEQIYVKPINLGDGDIPAEALAQSVVHCPPFSGIGAEERRMDRAAQNLDIGRGKPGDILRNLLHEVSQEEEPWAKLVRDIQDLFHFTLLKPEYDESLTPFIYCEYLAGVPRGMRNGLPAFDIASGGSGFLQVLLLMAFFYARPASVLLLDEPDAHLHVILQRQIYDRLRQVALQRDCQLIIATHSEVMLDGTSPSRVISFLGDPHRLVREDQRDQVREAMGRLTTLDLLLAEQGLAVLYCEGESDFKILKAWAQTLKHPARVFFEDPFFHENGGRNPREARAHLFALRAIQPAIRGLLLLDGDNRALPDHEVTGDGLAIIRWTRYEIENYLLVPNAIRRFLSPEPQDLFRGQEAEQAIEYLRAQLPPQTFTEPLKDNATVMAVRASKALLPQMFEAAGRALEKSDFFLLAEAMTVEEIHPEVITVLDAVAALRPQAPAGPRPA